jgi:diguanylate cyclase (GGDEF)-like protein
VGDRELARKMEALDIHVERIVELTNRVHDIALSEMDEQIVLAGQTERRMLERIVLVMAGGLLAAFTIGRVLARSVLKPVESLKKGAEKFAASDLSYRVLLKADDELGRLAGAFNQMAEALEKSQSALEYLAMYDYLTGAYNHREFHARLSEEMERARRYARPLALLMLDIDRFKLVNDTYGHQAGDEVLKALSKILQREVRAMDHVARYGGEEFALILPETTGPNALNIAERMRGVIEAASIGAMGREIRVTASIGVAAFPEDAAGEQEMISKADRALYAAKEAGRNRVRAAPS